MNKKFLYESLYYNIGILVFITFVFALLLKIESDKIYKLHMNITSMEMELLSREIENDKYVRKIKELENITNKNLQKIRLIEVLTAEYLEKRFVPYHLEVIATAYTNSPGEISKYYLDGKTSSNIPVGLGIIAVDPNYIPLGTIIYIPQFKQFFIALDTGNKIKGNRIDIFMYDKDKAVKFGKKKLDIIICGKIDDIVLKELAIKTTLKEVKNE